LTNHSGRKTTDTRLLDKGWEKVIRFFGSIFDILYSVELTIFLLTLLVGTAFDLDKIAKILLLGLQAFCSIIAYTHLTCIFALSTRKTMWKKNYASETKKEICD
jgi:hypothetical protein